MPDGQAGAQPDRPALRAHVADPEAIKAALPAEGGHKPLLYAATTDNWEAMANVAKGMRRLAGSAQQRRPGRAGRPDHQDRRRRRVRPGARPGQPRPGGQSLAQATQLRRLALKQNFRPLGFPIISFPGEVADSEEGEIVAATQFIAKYAGIVVMDHLIRPWPIPLLTLRLNIYTDPQKPISVDPGIYEFNSPKPTRPS
jgi:acetyl-CoA decarbonylase/synthase, CODH/ACS complex subunit gamma